MKNRKKHLSILLALALALAMLPLTVFAEDALPVLLAYVLSRFGRLNLIWLSFVLAEGIVVPIALTLWKKESRRTLVD